MTSSSYLISINTSQRDLRVTLAILNRAGRGHLICGSSNGTITRQLWFIPTGKGIKEDIIKDLQSMPAVQSISIITLSKPVKEEELSEVREFFRLFGWDASGITNEDLSSFLNSKALGQHLYYIHFGEMRSSAMVQVSIRPLQEQPYFSSLLQTDRPMEEETSDTELTLDDLEITTVEITAIQRDPHEP